MTDVGRDTFSWLLQRLKMNYLSLFQKISGCLLTTWRNTEIRLPTRMFLDWIKMKQIHVEKHIFIYKYRLN